MRSKYDCDRSTVASLYSSSSPCCPSFRLERLFLPLAFEDLLDEQLQYHREDAILQVGFFLTQLEAAI